MSGIFVALFFLCNAQGKRMKRMASDRETCPSKGSMISDLMFPAGSFVISLPAHPFFSSAHTWSHGYTPQCLAPWSDSAGTVSCGASLCQGPSCLIFTTERALLFLLLALTSRVTSSKLGF